MDAVHQAVEAVTVTLLEYLHCSSVAFCVECNAETAGVLATLAGGDASDKKKQGAPPYHRLTINLGGGVPAVVHYVRALPGRQSGNFANVSAKVPSTVCIPKRSLELKRLTPGV